VKRCFDCGVALTANAPREVCTRCLLTRANEDREIHARTVERATFKELFGGRREARG
jgi:hypothetical protein